MIQQSPKLWVEHEQTYKTNLHLLQKLIKLSPFECIQRFQGFFQAIIFMYTLILFLWSIIKHHPIEQCPFAIAQHHSSHYMLDKQQLRKVPHHVPAFTDINYPLRISRILIQTNENYEVPLQMYETMMNNIEMNPEFEYRFYNGEDRRRFMKQMGERYLRVYDTLIPSAYKADVFRYSAIYHYGGCYMDAGSFTVRPLAEFLRPTDEFVSSYDCEGYCLNSAFFCAEKGNNILREAINIIFRLVENHEYGSNSLDITGPYKFIEGLREVMKDPHFRIQPKDYGKGIRFFQREYHVPCLIAVIKNDTDVYILSKYPAYIADMRRYTDKERYGDAWKRRNVFQQLDENNTD